MAGGQEYSRYQRGVINRYYEHADTIALQRLSEIVSDLYLAEGGKAMQLWKSAGAALEKLAPAGDPRVAKVLKEKSVTALARGNRQRKRMMNSGRRFPRPRKRR
jgi:hypothetical protein